MEEPKNNELQELIDKAQAKYAEIEIEYGKFNELKNNLQNKIESFNDIEDKNIKINEFLEKITNDNKSIETIKNNINGINQEINDYYQKFKELKMQIDDENNGLEASFKWVKNKKDEADIKYEEIIKVYTSSEKLLEELEKLKEAGGETKNDILKLKEEVSKWLELISDSSRFNEFNKRKKQLTIESYIWMGIIVIGFLGLAFLVYKIFKEVNPEDTFVSSLNRVLYTTPMIFFLLWATKNYSNVRGYLEKYSFKAILSVSLSSYLELLENKFGSDCEELKQFSFDSMRKIFIEPYREKEKKQVLNFWGGKIFLENSEKPIANELDMPPVSNKPTE